MKLRLILFLIIAFALDTHSCVSIEYKFICGEYLPPVVKSFNNYPDTIRHVGVSGRELRADFLFDSVEFQNGVKSSLETASHKIHKGLKITSQKKTITISGKTEEIGIRSFKLTAINTRDSTQHAIVVVVKILDNDKCNVMENAF